jgi:hypothetical protein
MAMGMTCPLVLEKIVAACWRSLIRSNYALYIAGDPSAKRGPQEDRLLGLWVLTCKKHSHHIPLQCSYPPLSSFFTVSLTTLPSTRAPLAENLAIAFFMTVPMSFIDGDPISEMVARTTDAISSAPAAFGR